MLKQYQLTALKQKYEIKQLSKLMSSKGREFTKFYKLKQRNQRSQE
ncbi:unnamed protein product [Paramecium sonneborni]|uniref:Uncharacterized protein n=1 Tax=Paramecium sonneborni TaxID=65129 RepID=A0A8S1RSK2_9CILI|nr:unnamed protein product [Paramecium sonneborni]